MSTRRASPPGRKTSQRTSGSRSSSPAPPKLLEALVDASRALAGRRWYVFGAQAVGFYGVPRTTADVDVTVAPGPDGNRGLVAALEAAGFQLLELGDLDSFVARTRVLPFTHRRSGVGLDVVLSGPGLEEEFHQRAATRVVGRARLRVIEVNDLLVLKTLAGRPKDLEDVSGLLRAAPPGLDPATVVSRLAELERALDVSDLVPLFLRLERGASPR